MHPAKRIIVYRIQEKLVGLDSLSLRQVDSTGEQVHLRFNIPSELAFEWNHTWRARRYYPRAGDCLCELDLQEGIVAECAAARAAL